MKEKQMNETTLDEIDTRMAQSAAELLKTVLQAARCRAADVEMVDSIDALTACRLIVTAKGPQVKLELLAPIEGGMVLLYGGTFEEKASCVMH